MPYNARNLFSTIIFLFIAAMCTVGCQSRGGDNRADKVTVNDLDSIKARGELRILTLSSSTSYFLYKGEKRGYEYELAKRFADDLGVELKVIVAHNLSQLTQMLHNNEGDLIAYDIPITGDTKTELLHCGPERINAQVLVQSDRNPITDVPPKHNNLHSHQEY